MPNELVNPLTGERVTECAKRLLAQAKQHYALVGDARDYASVRVECFINSAMAKDDPRLADFYRAVHSTLTRGT